MNWAEAKRTLPRPIADAEPVPEAKRAVKTREELQREFLAEAVKRAETEFERLVKTCRECSTQFLYVRDYKRDNNFCSDECRSTWNYKKRVDRAGVATVVSD